jgi:hypothetical protein
MRLATVVQLLGLVAITAGASLLSLWLGSHCWRRVGRCCRCRPGEG